MQILSLLMSTERLIPELLAKSGQDGGDVVMNVPPAAGTLTIVRGTDQTQETDYVPFDPFPAESHETALDKAMFLTSQRVD